MTSRATVASTIYNYVDLLRAHLPVGSDFAAFYAVIAVEAGSSGIDTRYNRPIIRFEVHKFYELHGIVNRPVFDKYFKFNPEIQYTDHFYCTPMLPDVWIRLHEGTRDYSQVHEWYALNVAMQMDSRSHAHAIEASSWGAGQIMGFHWKALGFASPHALMHQAFTHEGQIKMFIDFIKADKELSASIVRKDWATFARIYNGKRQVKVYSEWMAEAYGHARALLVGS